MLLNPVFPFWESETEPELFFFIHSVLILYHLRRYHQNSEKIYCLCDKFNNKKYSTVKYTMNLP